MPARVDACPSILSPRKHRHAAASACRNTKAFTYARTHAWNKRQQHITNIYSYIHNRRHNFIGRLIIQLHVP